MNRFLQTITPPGGISYYNLVWNKEIKHKLVLLTGDLVFKIFKSIPHFKSLIPTKQNLKLFSNKTKKYEKLKTNDYNFKTCNSGVSRSNIDVARN